MDRLIALGIRCLKIHPPHQCYPANAYTEGLDALGRIYRRCEERGLPVLVHTGTSIFPGARSKWGNPMELDDVAIDFPKLTIVMAHGGRPLWMEEAFFILRRHPNVYLELSGIPPARLLEYFPRLTDIGRQDHLGHRLAEPRGARPPQEPGRVPRPAALRGGAARHPVGHQPSALPDPRPLILSRSPSRCVPSIPSPPH